MNDQVGSVWNGFGDYYFGGIYRDHIENFENRSNLPQTTTSAPESTKSLETRIPNDHEINSDLLLFSCDSLPSLNQTIQNSEEIRLYRLVEQYLKDEKDLQMVNSPSANMAVPNHLLEVVDLTSEEEEICQGVVDSTPKFDEICQEIVLWIEVREKPPGSYTCQEFLTKKLSKFTSSKLMEIFFYLYKRDLIYQLFHNLQFIHPVNADGEIDLGKHSYTTYKQAQIFIYFIKFFRREPQFLIQEFKANKAWVRDVFLLLWNTQVGKLGMSLIFEAIIASKITLESSSRLNYLKQLENILPRPTIYVDKNKLYYKIFFELILNFYEFQYRLNNYYFFLECDSSCEFCIALPSFTKETLLDYFTRYCFDDEASEINYLQAGDGSKKQDHYQTVAFKPSYEELWNCIHGRENISLIRDFFKKNSANLKKILVSAINLRCSKGLTNSTKTAALMKNYLALCLYQWEDSTPLLIEEMKQWKIQIKRSLVNSYLDFTNPGVLALFWNAYDAVILGGTPKTNLISHFVLAPPGEIKRLAESEPEAQSKPKRQRTV